MPRKNTGGKVGRPGIMNPERVIVVRQLIAKCMSTGKIEHLLAKEWDCSTQTIYNYIRKVYADLAAEDEINRPHRKKAMREMIQAHYEDCKRDKKSAAATQTLALLAKVDGCMEPDKLELSGPAGGPIATAVRLEVDLSMLTDEELDVMQRALAKTGG